MVTIKFKLLHNKNLKSDQMMGFLFYYVFTRINITLVLIFIAFFGVVLIREGNEVWVVGCCSSDEVKMTLHPTQSLFVRVLMRILHYFMSSFNKLYLLSKL